MSKYQPLEAHLRNAGRAQVPMTFGEIEKIIGAGLPPSAFKHRAWWSNNPSNSVITHAWLEAGYKTADVDLPGRKLMFHRSTPPRLHANPPLEPGGGPTVHGEANAPPEIANAGFFSRIFGALKGTVTVRPGTDLTAPVDTEWEAGR